MSEHVSAGLAGGRGLSASEKAAILVEALPWIRRLRGSVVVLKHGGAAMNEASLDSFATDVALLASVGLRPVVVHGGGPQIGAWMKRLGKEPVFVEGMRVTDAETLEIVRMVLVGKLNRDLVEAINTHGRLAVGCTGEDGGMIKATARSEELGFVGDVQEVDPSLLWALLAEDLIPVVATIATDRLGQAYNVNADIAAGAIAAALRATKLVFLTDVEGIRSDSKDPATMRPTLSLAEMEGMLQAGLLEGGMIPKARAAAMAIRGGVETVHVLDGRVPHALLLEIFTDKGIGTMVRPDAGGDGTQLAEGGSSK
jgi:acetylglutamate kinase